MAHWHWHWHDRCQNIQNYQTIQLTELSDNLFDTHYQLEHLFESYTYPQVIHISTLSTLSTGSGVRSYPQFHIEIHLFHFEMVGEMVSSKINITIP